MVDEMDVWTVAEAKARLSEVMERAERVGPQRLTRRGVEAAVVVSTEDWRRGGRRRSAAEVLLAPGFSIQPDYLDLLFARLAPARAREAPGCENRDARTETSRGRA